MGKFNFNILIKKKQQKEELTYDELLWLVDSYVKNQTLPDYQMSAMLMAIWFNGMTAKETLNLTDIYLESGKSYDLSEIKGIKIDKHSTGGIGDKTSLVFGPIIASYGLKLIKLSGRALGKTGGTLDKLESIPGWKCELSEAEFKSVVEKTGMVIVGASNEIAPADKKIYQLRDVTGTTNSVPLICASVMSKKLVFKSDALLLDIKVGKGAFAKNLDEGIALAESMIEIGKAHERKVSVLISNMDKPLGKTIGNAIEVQEAYQTLLGYGPEDLNQLVIFAVASVLVQTNQFADFENAKNSVTQRLKSGEAAKYLVDFVKAQGGDWSVMENYDQHFSVKHKIEFIADKDGYLKYKDAGMLGYLALELGAGRCIKTDKIDYAAGIYLNKQVGEHVKKGEVLITLLTNKNPQESWNKTLKNIILIDNSPVIQNVVEKIIF